MIKYIKKGDMRKMHIHWYPGHMTKALRVMQEELKIIDCIIYVMDARAPLSSINPKFDVLIERKPALYVLNKADMVEKSEILKWKNHFEKEGKRCITAVSTMKGGGNEIISNLIALNKDLIERHKNKGVNKTIRAMVVGIPNCGKSTLINSLVSKKKVITGNKPGVTRGKQWVNVAEHIDLLDTPGTLYPDFSDQNKARNLAFIGSISDKVVDDTELALEMLKFMAEEHRPELIKRYSLEEVPEDMYALLEKIGEKKGQLLKGGVVDIEKTAKAVIIDFRKQAFGKIILETVK